MRSKLRLMLMAMMVMLLSVVQINVNAAEETKIAISAEKATMNVGDEMKLTVTGTDKTPTWVSFNEKVVEVDQTGTVTALKAGTAKVQARVGGTYLSCTVKVVNASIKLNKKSATIYCGGTSTNTVELKATASGATKNADDVVWESSNPTVASVDKVIDKQGKVKVIVTGKSSGTATITATANGKTASCAVTVNETAIVLDYDNIQVGSKGAASRFKLSATVTGSSRKVTWTTSDEKIAKVSNGTVTGKSSGTATITATANNVSVSCKVTVTDGLVALKDKHITLYVGEKVKKGKDYVDYIDQKQLKTTASTKDEKNGLTWESSNSNVATVENGKVTAKGEGTAIISVKYKNTTDTCVVEVKKTSTKITNKNFEPLRTKGANKTYQLNCNVIGRSGKVKWTVDKEGSKIVSVSNGKLTAKKAGTAVITATANGKSDSVFVEVKDYEPGISLNQSKYTLYTGKYGNKVKIKATVDGTSKKVTWASSNTEVASVDKNGNVTANNAGTATIIAQANGKKAECAVEVKKTSIIFEQSGVSLGKDDKVSLAVDIIGASQNVKWSTSNAKVATVKNGIVTAKAMGSADMCRYRNSDIYL